MSKIGEYLKGLRGGLSIRKIAEETGISNAYLSQLESGKRDNPHPDVLKKLAKYYSVPMVDMLKQAGYLEVEETKKETREERVERQFKYVTSQPNYQYGHRIKGPVTLEIKEFIIEMYKKANPNDKLS